MSTGRGLKTLTPNLPLIVRRQRWAVVALSLILLTYALELMLGIVPRFQAPAGSPLIWTALVWILTVKTVTVLCIVLLLRAFKDPPVAIVVQAWIATMPFMDILMLMITALRVRTALAESGVKVGWLWVSDDEVARRLAGLACRKCGYTLTGNVSGRCPECGTAIAVTA